jgi:hypothetical protein
MGTIALVQAFKTLHTQTKTLSFAFKSRILQEVSGEMTWHRRGQVPFPMKDR